MAKKLKQIITLFALCSLIILSGCTQEKEFVNEHNHDKLKIENKSFKEVLEIPIFNESYQRLAHKKGKITNSQEARTALEDEFNFTIVESSPVKVITDSISTSYVLLIGRAVDENLKFENLVINIKDEEMIASILKYTLAEKATYVEEHESYSMDIVETSLEILAIEGKVSLAVTCIQFTTLMCNALGNGYTGDHVADLNCINYQNGLYDLETTFCFSGGGGSGVDNGNGDTGNTSWTPPSGPHSSGGFGNPVITTPVMEGSEVGGQSEINCAQLNKILRPQTGVVPSNSIPIKQAIKNLYNEVRDNTIERKKEKGYSFCYYGPSNSMYAELALPKDENAIKYRDQTFNFGGDHFHYDALEPMFSHDDIYQLYQFKTKFSMPANASHPNYPKPMHLMAAPFGVFAIMVKDEAQFNNIAAIYANKKLRRDFSKNLEIKYSRISTSSSPTGDKYIESFLKFITNIDNGNNYNLGLELYRAKFNPLGEPIGWERLELKKINGTNQYEIIKTDCNE